MIFRTRKYQRVRPTRAVAHRSTQTEVVAFDDGVDRRVDLDEDDEALPQCPIGRHAMRDPVVASDGHSYERRHLVKWLSRRGTSPMTGARIAFFVPNHALRAVVAEGVPATTRETRP